jgi:hypothetical protein
VITTLVLFRYCSETLGQERHVEGDFQLLHFLVNLKFVSYVVFLMGCVEYIKPILDHVPSGGAPIDFRIGTLRYLMVVGGIEICWCLDDSHNYAGDCDFTFFASRSV